MGRRHPLGNVRGYGRCLEFGTLGSRRQVLGMCRHRGIRRNTVLRGAASFDPLQLRQGYEEDGEHWVVAYLDPGAQMR